ncbi:MAG: hypothetical protein ACOX3E_08955 [Desulfomonilia bacterium]|jgi:hypothetical protein|uniref:Uncharacterized protein n=1 Tax=anaerobic digester metagenome TaxID=1263854 RepID=A0A485M3K5_9ZZZZ|nr:hypothetical protein [Pseudomonadota bacterium]HPD20170.1 hypothetical protein [Deltaproteobacteria bacterium]HPX17956.1 hypothetical protein [Deltaproteobacteria bacterium]HRS54858.1 hypothetical protein [Desulfomonilia bacterium]HRV34387.1 hypothetical protein [Desulfomonilia bacterium]
MGFLFRFITGAILFPFKLVKFILADIVIFGIIGGTMSLIRSILRFLFKPLSLAAVAGGVLVFLFSDDERRNKVKALIGM